MSNLHLRSGDEVVVISGKDKGKKGKILKAYPTDGKVLVQGINMVSRHTKARRNTDQAGILKKELPIIACKVMRVCPKCDKPTRIGRKLLDNSEKTRYCKNCLETID